MVSNARKKSKCSGRNENKYWVGDGLCPDPVPQSSQARTVFHNFAYLFGLLSPGTSVLVPHDINDMAYTSSKPTRLGFVLVQSSVGFLPYHIELTPNPFKLMRNGAWNAASLCPLPANLQPNPARVVVTRVSFLWAMLRNISIITTFLCYSSLTSSITE